MILWVIFKLYLSFLSPLFWFLSLKKLAKFTHKRSAINSVPFFGVNQILLKNPNEFTIILGKQLSDMGAFIILFKTLFVKIIKFKFTMLSLTHKRRVFEQKMVHQIQNGIHGPTLFFINTGQQNLLISKLQLLVTTSCNFVEYNAPKFCFVSQLSFLLWLMCKSSYFTYTISLRLCNHHGLLLNYHEWSMSIFSSNKMT